MSTPTSLKIISSQEKSVLIGTHVKNASPHQDHWIVVRRVLKYLRGTINYSLCFNAFPSVLEGFSDANWISDLDEMKSTSGFIFIIGGSVVS